MELLCFVRTEQIFILSWQLINGESSKKAGRIREEHSRWREDKVLWGKDMTLTPTRLTSLLQRTRLEQFANLEICAKQAADGRTDSSHDTCPVSGFRLCLRTNYPGNCTRPVKSANIPPVLPTTGSASLRVHSSRRIRPAGGPAINESCFRTKPQYGCIRRLRWTAFVSGCTFCGGGHSCIISSRVGSLRPDCIATTNNGITGVIIRSGRELCFKEG
ncbi:hypothetical protein J6590_020841 [Homalodisca vitripennis]|nr:hypothetical protein J6590_020841 [Homalodisca vitripennis]